MVIVQQQSPTNDRMRIEMDSIKEQIFHNMQRWYSELDSRVKLVEGKAYEVMDQQSRVLMSIRNKK